MVLAVNGFMILNGQRRTVFHSVQRVLVLKRTADLRTNRDLIIFNKEKSTNQVAFKLSTTSLVAAKDG